MDANITLLHSIVQENTVKIQFFDAINPEKPLKKSLSCHIAYTFCLLKK
jgi:hypothetical protein